MQHEFSLILSFTRLPLKTAIQHDLVLKREVYFLQSLSHHRNFYAVILNLVKAWQSVIQDLHICHILID